MDDLEAAHLAVPPNVARTSTDLLGRPENEYPPRGLVRVLAMTRPSEAFSTIVFPPTHEPADDESLP